MGRGQTPDIAEIKSEVAKIKKIVAKLYDRTTILQHVIEIVVPTIHLYNILVIPDLIDEILEEKKERKEKGVRRKMLRRRLRQLAYKISRTMRYRTMMLCPRLLLLT